jgi:hypothetical protein
VGLCSWDSVSFGMLDLGFLFNAFLVHSKEAIWQAEA